MGMFPNLSHFTLEQPFLSSSWHGGRQEIVKSLEIPGNWLTPERFHQVWGRYFLVVLL